MSLEMALALVWEWVCAVGALAAIVVAGALVTHWMTELMQ